MSRPAVEQTGRWVGLVMLGAVWTGDGYAQQRSGEPLASPLCHLRGVVLDADLGDPVAGAAVWLEELDGGRLAAAQSTGGGGEFLFILDACSPMRLRVRMLGFENVQEVLEPSAPVGAYDLTLRMARQPLELEELRVEVPRSRRLLNAGFYARKAWIESTGEFWAQFLDPDEVAGRSQAIHSAAGIAMSTRLWTLFGACEPSVYVDGRRFLPRHRDSETYDYLEQVERFARLRDVEGVEVYRPLAAAIPPEFRDYNSYDCGAVVIWTRYMQSDSLEAVW